KPHEAEGVEVTERRATSVIALLALALGGGGQNAQSVTLRSLESSGAMSFVCLGATAHGFFPRRLDQCPDRSNTDGEFQHLYSLVTQLTRGEVAVVDLIQGAVVDQDVAIPGFNFLQVGSEPGAIVSTPGSTATFVGGGAVGSEGIFALPSSCITPRTGKEPVRDLTTWSACRLPSAPGAMAVLLDTKSDRSC